MVNDKTAPPPPLYDVVFEADMSIVAVDNVIALAGLSMRSSSTQRTNDARELAIYGKITLCTCGRDLAEAYAKAASIRLQRWAAETPAFASCKQPLFTIRLIKNA
jgi:hypothetical protein